MTYMSVWAVAQPCPTLRNPMDCDPPGSSAMGVPRQEYWSRLPFSSPGIFLTQGLNPYLLGLLHWQVDSLLPVPPGKPLLKLSGIKHSVSAKPCWQLIPFIQFSLLTSYFSQLMAQNQSISDIVSISNTGLFQLWSCAFDLPEFTYLVKF